MAAAFTGYILLWGQMSFSGATVVTIAQLIAQVNCYKRILPHLALR